MGESLNLSEKDRGLFGLMKEAGVFTEIRARSSCLDSICVRCADCDIGHELDSHYQQHCGSKRHQLFSLNGGALLLAKTDATREAGLWPDGDVLMKNIRTAMAIKKGLSAISLFIHGPCGIARQCGWDMFDCVHNLMLGKQRLRGEIINPELNIIPFCHIVENGECKRFHVNRRAWYAFTEHKPDELEDDQLIERLRSFRATAVETSDRGAG